MFGYVLVNKPELKFKEYDVYRSYYCGLCKIIKHRHGFFARLCVNYDLTFLAMLLTSLNECETIGSCERCIVHPFSKHTFCENKYLEYCSDMNVYLAYLKCIDDWVDERNIISGLYGSILKNKAKKVEKIYDKKTAVIKEKMSKLAEVEKNKSTNLDEASGIFGDIMKEIFIVDEYFFKNELGKVAFFLGKYIYLLDAYNDLEEDKKNKNYNPWISYENREDFEKFVRDILVNTMANCCQAFEFLPVVENINILRNILYAGVWTKYRSEEMSDYNVNAKNENEKK